MTGTAETPEARYQREREEAAMRVVAARMDASIGHREESLPGRRAQRRIMGHGEPARADSQYDVLRYRSGRR